VLIIYANLELINNTNTDCYIDASLSMKESIIFLFFFKSKFIFKKNPQNMEQNKYFHGWSKVELESTKINNFKDDKYYKEWDNVIFLNLASNTIDAGNITGVENVTINNSKISEKNIITISTEEIEEKIRKLPSLSEKIINLKIVKGELESKEFKDRVLDINSIDFKFQSALSLLKISSLYITNKNYLELVNLFLEKITNLGLDSEYLKELEEILRKGKKDFSSKNSNINLEDNPIFNKYFDLYLELSEPIKKKNSKINLSIWNDFIQLFETSEKFKHDELTKITENIINKLKQEYIRISDENFYKEYPQKQKKRKRNSDVSSSEMVKVYFKDSSYQKILNDKLLELFNELKKEQTELLTKFNINIVNTITTQISDIEKIISNFSWKVVKAVLDSGNISKSYSDNPKIIKKVLKKDTKLAIDLYYEKNSSDLSVLLNNIKNIDSIKINKVKLSK
jgi:hypothetical protein